MFFKIIFVFLISAFVFNGVTGISLYNKTCKCKVILYQDMIRHVSTYNFECLTHFVSIWAFFSVRGPYSKLLGPFGQHILLLRGPDKNPWRAGFCSCSIVYHWIRVVSQETDKVSNTYAKWWFMVWFEQIVIPICLY